MTLEILAFVLLGLIVVSILAGIPVAFALSSLPLIFGFVFLGDRILPMYPMQCFGVMLTYPFLACPLFILMGSLMEKSGIADQLYNSFYQLLGTVRGGLAIATVAMATIFGACTGNVGAGVITIGLLALPPMLARGYDKALATGCIMVGGGLGVTIPPSLMLILYGASSGVSISALFVAALIPGILMGFVYMVYIYVKASLKPEVAPPIKETDKIRGLPLVRMVFTSLIPPIFLILAVLGSIFFGVVSPSEAGAMGVLGAGILTVVYGKFSKKMLTECITYTLRITSAIVFICFGGKLFTSIFIGMGGDRGLVNFMELFNLGTTGMIFMMLFIVFLMGMIMDWIALIFILVPIYGPILKTLGVDPLYFGIMFCLVLQVSNITPPFAYSVFYLKTITPKEVTIGDMYRGCIPFACVTLIVPLLVFLFPKLALWLPALMQN